MRSSFSELKHRGALVPAAIIVTLVAVAVSTAVISRRGPADNGERPVDTTAPEWASPDRLVLPDHGEPDGIPFVPFRPRRERWTEQEIAEYWFDPQEIGVDVLDERVERSIRELLRGVP